MELANPWVLYIAVPLMGALIIILFIKFRRKDVYKKGKKVGETDYITETNFYKSMLLRYNVLKYLILILIIMSILFSMLLLSRPSKKQVLEPEINNRDIFLCMDISDSMDELNLEICDELDSLVAGLEGERFGITIFNGRSVLLVPLTTDYDYVRSMLKELKKAFQYTYDIANGDWLSYMSGIDYETYYYKYEGTLCDYGSSFIGDGLASALYSFNDLKENTDRTRLIIFTTDNELNGTPTVTVDQAAALCKKNNVKVFAIAPEKVVDEANFKAAIESTDGGYYRSSNSKAIKELIKDIKATKESAMVEEQTLLVDNPKTLFIWLLVFTGSYIILSRRIKL